MFETEGIPKLLTICLSIEVPTIFSLSTDFFCPNGMAAPSQGSCLWLVSVVSNKYACITWSLQLSQQDLCDFWPTILKSFVNTAQEKKYIAF